MAEDETPREEGIEDDRQEHESEHRPGAVDGFGHLPEHDGENRPRHRPGDEEEVAPGGAGDGGGLPENLEHRHHAGECDGDHAPDHQREPRPRLRRSGDTVPIPASMELGDCRRHRPDGTIGKGERKHHEVARQGGGRELDRANMPDEERVGELQQHLPSLPEKHRSGERQQRDNHRPSPRCLGCQRDARRRIIGKRHTSSPRSRLGPGS